MRWLESLDWNVRPILIRCPQGYAYHLEDDLCWREFVRMKYCHLRTLSSMTYSCGDVLQ